MRRPLLPTGVVLSLSVVVLLVPSVASAAFDASEGRAKLAGVRMPFIANEGQLDARVAYYAPTFAGTVFVTRQGQLVYALGGPPTDAKRDTNPPSSGGGWTLTETLLGGRARPVAQDRSATGVSTFLGRDPAHWRSGLSTWEQVSLGEVWPGVSLAVRARGRSMEKVFTVRPGGAVARIRVRVAGAQALTVDREGGLVVRTGLGPVTFSAPVAYQERAGARRPVAVAYRQRGMEYGFRVGAYDPGLPLVIDPLLQSTYLGGSGSTVERATAMAIHPTTGDVYVTGPTFFSMFPGTAGGAQPTSGGFDDAFVARLSGSLTSLIQATYLGGSNSEEPRAIAIHPTTGNVYVAGGTHSRDFPGTGGSAQPAYGGGILFDAFVARLSSTLTSLVQATYLGGSNHDEALALAIHPATGDVYVAGHTRSSNNFPGTIGGAQPAFGGGFSDAFVAQLPHTLTTLTQATYVGGSNFDDARGLAIHATTGDVYVAGGTDSGDFPGTGGGAQPAKSGSFDAFVVRLPRTLTSLTQATFFGGSGVERAAALAIHPATGDVYVAGSTSSGDLPGTAGGAQPGFGGGFGDAFVARLHSALTSLPQATYLGGSGIESVAALAIHPTTGDVYAAGHTDSENFPGTAGGVQPAFGANDVDFCLAFFDRFVGTADVIFSVCNGFVARLSRSLTTLTQATYLGGSSHDQVFALAIHGTTGDIYVGGSASSIDFPGVAGGAQPALSSGVFQTDAFVARLTFGLALVDPSLLLSASVNQPTFAVGQTLVAGGAVNNPGLPWSADFYVGISRPDGSIQFFTGGGIVVGHVADLTSFRPLAQAVPLGTPFSMTAPDFHTHQWTADQPRGSYVFFVAAVKTGALAAGTITSNQILGLATAPFSLP